MHRAYRAAIVVLFAMMALTAMSYLSSRFARGDREKGVAAVQDHLYAGGGEAAFRDLLAKEYGLADPQLRWWGRVTSNFYGVVQVTLVAQGAGQEQEFVWEIGLISGDLVPKNDAAASLLQRLAQANGAGSAGGANPLP
jgi:hypothetical protein